MLSSSGGIKVSSATLSVTSGVPTQKTTISLKSKVSTYCGADQWLLDLIYRKQVTHEEKNAPAGIKRMASEANEDYIFTQEKEKYANGELILLTFSKILYS